MNDCIFCRIVKKEVPNYTVYEEDGILAFLDIHPHAKGHTVVIPKVHAETIVDLDEHQAGRLVEGVKRSMMRITEVLCPDGFTAGWNHGAAGGQAVPHVHVHILPRWHGDGGGSMHSILKNPGDMSVAEVAKLFV